MDYIVIGKKVGHPWFNETVNCSTYPEAEEVVQKLKNKNFFTKIHVYRRTEEHAGVR